MTEEEFGIVVEGAQLGIEMGLAAGRDPAGLRRAAASIVAEAVLKYYGVAPWRR